MILYTFFGFVEIEVNDFTLDILKERLKNIADQVETLSPERIIRTLQDTIILIGELK